MPIPISVLEKWSLRAHSGHRLTQVGLMLISNQTLDSTRQPSSQLDNGEMSRCPNQASPLNVRFLITFDDGPHANTGTILSRLTKNSVQPDLKAIFFVQTRNSDGGASREGRALLHRTHLEGHVLGLHTGTPRGHVSHTGMSQSELDQSLRNGKEDISRCDRPQNTPGPAAILAFQFRHAGAIRASRFAHDAIGRESL